VIVVFIVRSSADGVVTRSRSISIENPVEECKKSNNGWCAAFVLRSLRTPSRSAVYEDMLTKSSAPAVVGLVLIACGDRKAPSAETAPEPVAAKPVAPAALAAPATYEDYPVGVGPCRFVDIKEVSEIVGAQLQYISPEPDNIACMLLPATSHAAARASKNATLDEIAKEVPALWVYTIDPGTGDWSSPGVAGIGDKAIYVGTKLQVKAGKAFFNIELQDPNTADPKPKLEIGRAHV
jgi:hypothetical protein